MSNAIRLLECILVEDTTLVVLPPVLWVHRIFTDQLELSEAIVPVVGASCTVDDEVLSRVRVDELFWSFVGGQTLVEGSAVWRLFPCVIGHADDLPLGEI